MAPAAQPNLVEFSRESVKTGENAITSRHENIIRAINERQDAQHSPDRFDAREHHILALGSVQYLAKETSQLSNKPKVQRDCPAVFTTLSRSQEGRFPESFRQQLLESDYKDVQILRMWVFQGNLIRGAYVTTKRGENGEMVITGIIQELPKTAEELAVTGTLNLPSEDRPFQRYIQAAKAYWGAHERLDNSTLMDFPFGLTMKDIRNSIITDVSSNTIWYRHDNELNNQEPGESIKGKLTLAFVPARKIYVPSIYSKCPAKQDGPFTRDDLEQYEASIDIYIRALEGFISRMVEEAKKSSLEN